MTWLALGIGAFWLLLTLVELRGVLALRELPPRRAVAPVPDVTVVMAVRDDMGHVAASVQQVLQQTAVALQLVVVDDRSTDGTSRVLAGIAAAEPRMRVRTVLELPPDWLGKTHALHVGTADTTTRSTLQTLRRGGVAWRGTFHPLAKLRRGQVR